MGKGNKKNRKCATNIFSDEYDSQNHHDHAPANPYELLCQNENINTNDGTLDNDNFTLIKKKGKCKVNKSDTDVVDEEEVGEVEEEAGEEVVDEEDEEVEEVEEEVEEEAGEEVDEEVEEVEDDTRSYFSRGLESKKNENYVDAKDFYKKSIELDNGDLRIKSAYNLAILYSDIFDDNVNAKYYYEIAYKMNHSGATSNLGLLLMRTKEYKESLCILRKAVRFGKFHLIPNFIECLCLLGRNDEAFELLEKYKKYIDMDDEIKNLFALSVKLPDD